MTKKEIILAAGLSLLVGLVFGLISLLFTQKIWINIIISLIIFGGFFILMMFIGSSSEPYYENEDINPKKSEIRSWYYLSRSKGI